MRSHRWASLFLSVSLLVAAFTLWAVHEKTSVISSLLAGQPVGGSSVHDVVGLKLLEFTYIACVLSALAATTFDIRTHRHAGFVVIMILDVASMIAAVASLVMLSGLLYQSLTEYLETLSEVKTLLVVQLVTSLIGLVLSLVVGNSRVA